ncbi:MAG TPA: peptide chain release factor N(5)-glutamine methyltransferase [Usitatibacter sp.]|nr:peptide chain release factor N(5)-glutamine methyltransferase [Usitatibacter sp.]
MLTLKAALEEATAAIGKVDAQAIFTHLLGVNRAYLAANPMRVLTETEDARIDSLVARRSMGHPVAYLLGRREFYSREFGVGPDVLIPRPETETLVEQALLRVGDHGRCLDLGTGSGAIAITLACERPGLALTATDTSAAALAVARANAAALGCAERIDFRAGAWYAAVAGERFRLIVANPPYVAAGDVHLEQGDLRFEPMGALTDGSADGLDSIRTIVAEAPAHLEADGWLLLEHGHDQARAAHALLAAAGFDTIVSIADLAGVPRVAGGKIDPSTRRDP